MLRDDPAAKKQKAKIKMNREQLTEAIETGELYAADVMADSAYVYYEPTGIEWEHAAHYVKIDGVWTWDDGLFGDLVAAIGGEEVEPLMLKLLGLIDDKGNTVA